MYYTTQIVNQSDQMVKIYENLIKNNMNEKRNKTQVKNVK
jgi:hypothetical protein